MSYNAARERHDSWQGGEWPGGGEWQPPTPENQVRSSPENPGPEEHDWRLAGTKRDTQGAKTYFLWGCPKCRRRTVTDTASLEGEHFADQSHPSRRELERDKIDEDCRQAAVDAVHRL